MARPEVARTNLQDVLDQTHNSNISQMASAINEILDAVSHSGIWLAGNDVVDGGGISTEEEGELQRIIENLNTRDEGESLEGDDSSEHSGLDTDTNTEAEGAGVTGTEETPTSAASTTRIIPALMLRIIKLVNLRALTTGQITELSDLSGIDIAKIISTREPGSSPSEASVHGGVGRTPFQQR